MTVRDSHHGDFDLDAFEPAEAVHPGAFDRHLQVTAVGSSVVIGSTT
jgi:hypothetical protein